jgi:hypothetical protein
VIAEPKLRPRRINTQGAARPAGKETDEMQNEIGLGLLSAVNLYQVKPGREEEFLELLGRAWPELRERGIVEECPWTVEQNESARSIAIQILTWRASEQANRPCEVPFSLTISGPER